MPCVEPWPSVLQFRNISGQMWFGCYGKVSARGCAPLGAGVGGPIGTEVSSTASPGGVLLPPPFLPRGVPLPPPRPCQQLPQLPLGRCRLRHEYQHGPLRYWPLSSSSPPKRLPISWLVTRVGLLKSRSLPRACPSGHCLGDWPPWGGTQSREHGKPAKALENLHPSQERVPTGCPHGSPYLLGALRGQLLGNRALLVLVLLCHRVAIVAAPSK